MTRAIYVESSDEHQQHNLWCSPLYTIKGLSLDEFKIFTLTETIHRNLNWIEFESHRILLRYIDNYHCSLRYVPQKKKTKTKNHSNLNNLVKHLITKPHTVSIGSFENVEQNGSDSIICNYTHTPASSQQWCQLDFVQIGSTNLQ